MAAIVQETTQTVMDDTETEADGYSYKIDLYTGDIWGAGTDANVLLTIYGEDGDSGQRILDNSGNNFERDSKDNFKIVNKSYLGRIQKITIGHDNSGIGPAWFLNKVTVEDVKTGEVFEFPCARWFSTEEDDGFISRDLTWSDVTVKEKKEGETHHYTINIYTGDAWGAGTDANVHVTIYGTKGDSGEQRFENKGQSTFESAMKNTYKIETNESLGTLYKVRVGHDNTGWGPGWLLYKIEVEDDSNGEVVEFACGKWLATDSEDGLIRRDLMREGFVEEVDSPHENVTYTINILTGNEWGAGTDSNIYFTLYGTAGESEQQTIENEGSTTFECGMTDMYKFECPYLGTLTKIRIGHDNTGWGPAWFLEKVTVEDPKQEQTVVFPCHRWLATNADDGMIERELTREGMFGDEIIIEGLTEGLKGEALGMETGEIKDDNITASSYAEDTPPSNARLHNTAGWCAKEAEGSWLQVDLESLHCVTSIASQGNPGGNEDYVKKYKLQYSQDEKQWTTHEENGNQIFDANEDNNTVKKIDLQKVIVARYVRIYPVEWYCWPCMRIEVYGVPLKEGGTEVRTVSYVTEQVVVTREEKEAESVPERSDEQHKAEDAIQLILSQTGEKRKDIEEQKKLIDDEMKKLEDERKEREKLKEEERKRMEEEERKREEEEQKKREEEQKKKELEEEERRMKVELEVKKIEEEHQQRLDELDRKMREDEEKNRKELEEKKEADEEALKRLDDEMKKDQEMIKKHEQTRLRYEEKMKELQSAGIIKTETTTETFPKDDGVETITITRQVIVESTLDDDLKGKDSEEQKQREKKEKEREREEKLRRMQEEEERRLKEEKDFNEIMLTMRIKAEREDDERKKREEEEENINRKKAKEIKEKEDKQRQEREEETKKKEEEKAKRRGEREKKRILIETRKTSSTESLSSLSSSSSSSSSSEDEDDKLISNVETEGFKAPIASVDEDDESVTKVVTYRTSTTTTTRIVSWPGTYFFKPIEPGARQQPLPEDVGLLFGIENIKPYKGMACCDHLKPVDPAVKTAQEISFEEKLTDNKGPLPSWIDKETPLQLYTPINAIGDEDIDKLVEWEKAGTQGWKRNKKSRYFEIWTRKAYEGGPPITKAIVTLNEIPYNDAVDIIRDWDTRQDWDKTFDKVTVLETIESSRLVYCPVKKRELFLAVQDRQGIEEQYYACAWKNTTHPKIDNNKNKQLKLYYLVSGLVIRPIDGGSQVTLLCQVKGSVPSQVKSTFLAANPTKWMDTLKKHHAKKTKENAVKEE